MTQQVSIYLDYAAATPLDKNVEQSMHPYSSKDFYNPSALYLAAKDVRTVLEVSRKKVAVILGARPGEIVFTSGGTEANNLAVKGVMDSFPDANLVISSIEHESVRAAAGLYAVKEAGVDKYGLLDIGKLAKAIDENTVLVSVMYANNEIGSIQPIKKAAKLLQQIRKNRQAAGNALPIYLHVDACQAANYLDLHVSRLGIDLMTLNGGKIYGPKQTGALYVKSGIEIVPQIRGGGQERGFRSGTENVPGIVGFAQALGLAQSMSVAEKARLSKLQQLFFEKAAELIPGAKINGSLPSRLPNNISLRIPGQDNERLVMQLDELGVMCAVGSACSASKEESSHVLRAIGLSDKQARETLRFTMGRGTSQKDVVRTVEILAKSLA